MEWGAIVEARGTEGKEVLSSARDGFAEYFDLEVAARGVKLDIRTAVSINVFSNSWKMRHHGSRPVVDAAPHTRIRNSENWGHRGVAVEVIHGIDRLGEPCGLEQAAGYA